jgi:PIN domain nuclease of toxin-antitoxin system
LTQVARQLIVDADEVFVSSASIWEASVKIGLEAVAKLVKPRLEARPANQGAS